MLARAIVVVLLAAGCSRVSGDDPDPLQPWSDPNDGFVCHDHVPGAVDADGDGWCSIASGGLDCDDEDPHVHPGAREVWGNLIDDNCNGCIDEPYVSTQITMQGGFGDGPFDGAWHLLVYFFGGDPAGFRLGMVDTSTADPLLYEACLDGATGCHPLVGEGEHMLRVVYKRSDLVLGETTLQVSMNHRTSVLWDSTGACFAFGHDPSFYPSCCPLDYR